MIVSCISCYFVTFLLICTIIVLVVLNSRIGKNEQTSPQPVLISYYKKQLQLLKLYNNIKCWRDEDLKELSETFDPLENLHLYNQSESELVRKYFEDLKAGRTRRRDEPFTHIPTVNKEIKTEFRIFYFIDDWDLFYKTAAFTLARANPGVFFWALSTLISSKYAHEHFRTPPTYEIFPQMFAPKRVLYFLNRLQEVESNLTNGLEKKLDHFRDDPSLNAFHLARHIDFPFWWDYNVYPILKHRKGELFLYAHRQIVNRYRAERISVGGLYDFPPINLKEPIKVGYVPSVLHINHEEFPTRLNNTFIRDLTQQTVDMLQKEATVLQEAISRGYFLSDNGTQVSLKSDTGYDILGATVESSVDSISQNVYGSFHNRLHWFISQAADPGGSLKLLPGVDANPDVTARDPVFYRIHNTIDTFYRQQSRNLPPYTEADLIMEEVELRSVRVLGEKEDNSPGTSDSPTHADILETFFEDFSFDVTNGIQSCNASASKRTSTTIKRLNHKSFNYHLSVYSNEAGNINRTVRIYISPVNGFDGKPYHTEKLFANMIEMDRFTVVLSRGENSITRSSKDSSVTVPDSLSTEQLLKETQEAIDAGKEKPQDWSGLIHTRHCGYPQNLLVPRGTSTGMRFTLFVIITEEEKGLNYPGLAICGVESGLYPDKKPMGYPFERKVMINRTEHGYNYKFVNVIIKHVG